MEKFTKEWRKENGVEYQWSYTENCPEGGMTFEVYDKSGNVRSRTIFNKEQAEHAYEVFGKFLSCCKS